MYMRDGPNIINNSGRRAVTRFKRVVSEYYDTTLKYSLSGPISIPAKIMQQWGSGVAQSEVEVLAGGHGTVLNSRARRKFNDWSLNQWREVPEN